MKTFNEWMNEDVTNQHGTEKRYVAFQPEFIPHPIIVADHVWSECSKVYTLRLDSFLTQLRILMKDDVRATAKINEFKEEMVRTMVANAFGFTKDSVEPIQNLTDNGPEVLNEKHELTLKEQAIKIGIVL